MAQQRNYPIELLVHRSTSYFICKRKLLTGVVATFRIKVPASKFIIMSRSVTV